MLLSSFFEIRGNINSHEKQNTMGSKSQTGQDLRDERLIMSLLYQPHTSRSLVLSFLQSVSLLPSVELLCCDDRELI